MKKLLFITLAFFIFVFPLLPSCATAGSSNPKSGATVEEQTITPESQKESEGRIVVYRAGAGDILAIDVFGENELSGKYTVTDNGTIDFPLIGSISVKGRTIDEVRSSIQFSLSQDYLVNPKVQVTIDTQGARGKIYVSGAVKAAGAYPYESGLTALNVVVLAGGFTELANPARTRLTRRHNNKTKTIKINLKKVLKGKGADPELQPGDRLFIPESLI